MRFDWHEEELIVPDLLGNWVGGSRPIVPHSLDEMLASGVLHWVGDWNEYLDVLVLSPMADSSEDSVAGWIGNFGKKRIGVAVAEKADLAAQGLDAATVLLAHIDEIEPFAAESISKAVVGTLVAVAWSWILDESALAVAPAPSWKDGLGAS